MNLHISLEASFCFEVEKPISQDIQFLEEGQKYQF